MMMAGIFKAYDIRGIYGETLTAELAERLGQAFVTLLNCRRVVVGRDMRPHSTPLFAALAAGLTRQGADVLDLGLCSTPMSYFANHSLEADAGIMITASHNPGAWNGFKLCRAQAVPISGATGIQDLERLVATGAFAPPPATAGQIIAHPIADAYAAHIRALAPVQRPLRIAVDFANGMGTLETRAFPPEIEVTPLFEEPDGSFPNHEATPLKPETYQALQKTMRGGSFDFGLAFDGDADRVGFTDETGAIIPMDLITALIAQILLAREKGPILYDLRSSWAVREVIAENGGVPLMCRVGHAYIKQQMRAAGALFAGELSGHYYFRENGYTESAALAALLVASLVSSQSRPLSAWIQPLRRYCASGELNFEVADSAAVLARLKAHYGTGRVTELDGLTIEYPDWWFNVRESNTEPLVRLNVEARTPEVLAARQAELGALLSD
ncbi:MAG: phosphomannomutase/phosphoglucomutase [Candidatus Marinimicrobia bacterium]|nr:phosphomannomutase/phosphoglucomutase [Candidatus Neomarinimicrobiota bacterium]